MKRPLEIAGTFGKRISRRVTGPLSIKPGFELSCCLMFFSRTYYPEKNLLTHALGVRGVHGCTIQEI